MFGIEKEVSSLGCSLNSDRMRVVTPEPRDNNRYLYARNNPVMFTDITGEYCGPGPFDFFIRDKYLGCDFTEACKNHDKCYNDCHNGDLYWKNVCDEQFREDMQKVTNRSPWFFQQACEWQAMHFHAAVRDFGGRAYRVSQEEGCKCK